MATQEHDEWRYLIIWEFRVRAGMEERFEKVYGPQGPKMTWEQRAKAGVPASKFQAALASAVRQAK